MNKKQVPSFEQWSARKDIQEKFPKVPAITVAEFMKSHGVDLNAVRQSNMREEYEQEFGIVQG